MSLFQGKARIYTSIQKKGRVMMIRLFFVLEKCDIGPK